MNKGFFSKAKGWALSHKKTSAIILLALVFLGYKEYKNLYPSVASVQYITAKVERGTIVSSVTGTGQVSASNRVDVASEVSGDVISVPVKLGDSVKKGQVLARIDSADSARAVQNAELGLENANIAYDKAQKGVKDQSTDSSISDLNKAYDDAYTDVADTMIDVPDIVSGMDSIFYDPSHSPYFGDLQAASYAGQTAIDYKYEAGINFDKGKNDYSAVFKDYKSLNASDRDALVALVQSAYEMIKKLHTAATGAYNTIDYIKQRIPTSEMPTQITTDKNTLSSYITKLGNHMDTLSGVLTNIENAKDSATNATLDLKSAELKLAEAQDTLKNSKDDLANHTITAPFDGTVGKVSVEVGDKISTNSTVATLITDQKVAEVSLNEVDVSNVKVGDKATITFDAIDGLSITGTVTQVDLLGTVSQGVVSYTVKIAFDVNDDRVKTGMSLSADIETGITQDALRVQTSAVKSQNNQNYIEALDSAGAMVKIPIVTGTSNDEYTQVLSGLNENDSYISKTITQTAAQTTQAPSLFGGSGTRNSGASLRAIQGR